MKFYLVKYFSSWADEICVSGFKAMTEEDWESFVNQISVTDKFPWNYYIGTNEGITYRNAAQFLYDFEAKEISATDYKVLHKLFPEGCHGFWPEGPEDEDWDDDDHENDDGENP